MPPALTAGNLPAAESKSWSLEFLSLTAAGLLAVVTWDLSGLDLPLARLAGGVGGFPLRNNPILETYLHAGMRDIGWALLAILLWNIQRPFGLFRLQSRRERIQMPASILLGLAAVAILKFWSRTSCPWDLHEFGGVLPYVSHWNLAVVDGGGGHCFPGGHASAGFAFVGGYFALRRAAPGVAFAGLAVALAVGLLLGVSQQLRGAHFMSHTLWTAWLCWAVGGVVDMVVHRRIDARSQDADVA